MEGHAHQIVDGSPLDPLHLCPATVTTTIKMYLETDASSRVTWSCGGCKRTYRSTTAECNQEDCRGLASRLKTEVTKRTLEAISKDIILQVLPYDQDSGSPPNILSTVKLAEVLLSPHDQDLSGLMASAWNTPTDSANLVCNCLALLEIQAGVNLDDNLEPKEVTPVEQSRLHIKSMRSRSPSASIPGSKPLTESLKLSQTPPESFTSRDISPWTFTAVTKNFLNNFTTNRQSQPLLMYLETLHLNIFPRTLH